MSTLTEFISTLVCLVAIGAFVIWLVGFVYQTHYETKPWPHENEMCACSHGYYDHIHHTNESPCTKLMCSCYQYERKETP